MCYYFYTFLGYYTYFDSATYNIDAYDFSTIWSRMQTAGGIFAGTADAINFSHIFERLFGRKPLKGVIEAAGGDAIAIPNDVKIPEITRTVPNWRLFGIWTLVTIEIEALKYPLQYRYIFRIVDDAEYASIAACHCFSFAPGGLEVKQFWTNPLDADKWAMVGMRGLTIPDGTGRNATQQHRSQVFVMIRQSTFNLGHIINEPTIGVHVDFDFATLPVLNNDIATSPFGTIKMLRDYPAEPQ